MRSMRILLVVLACVLGGTVGGCTCSKEASVEGGKTRNGKPIGEPANFLLGKWTGTGVEGSGADDTRVMDGLVKLTQIEFTKTEMKVVNKVRPEKSYQQTFTVKSVDESTIYIDTKRKDREASPARIIAVDPDTIWIRHANDVAYGVYARMKN